MEIRRMKITELKLANYNPQSRTNHKGITALKASIDKIGLIYPITITKTKQVIDGHRRIAACKSLGWEDIPALVVTNEESRETIYAEINATSSRLNGSQHLQVWLKEPSAVTPFVARVFEKNEKMFGIGILRRLARSGLSPAILNVANRVSAYLDNDSDQFRRKTALWLIRHRNTQLIRGYMALNQPTKTLLRAIIKNKPLQVVYQS